MFHQMDTRIRQAGSVLSGNGASKASKLGQLNWKAINAITRFKEIA